MRILVTGADGFVGRHATTHLGSVGHEVVEAYGPHDSPLALDVTSSQGVDERVSAVRPEAVLHLAGSSSVAQSHEDPALTFRVNLMGTLHVLQALRRSAPKARFLLVSSGEVYGAMTSKMLAREDDACMPTSPYGASKVAAEQVALQYHRSYGSPVIIARPFNHLGAGQQRSFVVPSFASQLEAIRHGKQVPILQVGNLEPVRDFSHVSDIVEGYRLLLEKGVPGEIYNLCSAKPLRIRDVLDQLVQRSGVDAKVEVDPARLRPADIPWLVGDATKVEKLGFKQSRSVGDALDDVLGEARRDLS